MLRDNKPFLLRKLAEDGLQLRCVPLSSGDPEIVRAAITNNGNAIQYAATELTGCKELVLLAVRGAEFESLWAVDPVLRADREVALAAAPGGEADVLEWVSDALRRDIEVVRAVVAHNGMQVKYAKGDAALCPTVHALAVAEDGMALRYIPASARTKELVLVAVGSNGGALRYVSNDLRKDPEVIYAAAMSPRAWGPSPMFWAPSEAGMLSNPTFVRAAVKQHPGALEFADPILLKDVDFVKSILREWPEALLAVTEHSPALHDSISNDRTLLLEMVAKSSNALRYASEALLADKELVLCALRTGLAAIVHLPLDSELLTDPDVISATVQRPGGLRVYLETLYALGENDALPRVHDRGLLMQAVAAWPDTLQYAAEELRADRTLVRAAVGVDGDALQLAAENLRADAEIVLAAVRQQGLALRHARLEGPGPVVPRDARKAIVLAAVKGCGDAMRYVPAEYRRDLSVILAALPTMRLDSMQFVQRPKNECAAMLVEKIAAGGTAEMFEQAYVDVLEGMISDTAVAMPYLSPQVAQVAETFVASLCAPGGLTRKRDRDMFCAEMGVPTDAKEGCD